MPTLPWSNVVKIFPFPALQNCSARCCTRRHLFTPYKSSLGKLPGGGSAVLDIIWTRWLGVRGSKLSGLFKLSTMRGRLSTMTMASYGRVRSEASLSLSLESERVAFRTLLTVLIWWSHTPPAWLEWGAFMTKSHCFCDRNVLSLCMSSSFKAALNSFFAPTKFVPWSHWIWRTAPRIAIKHLRPFMKASVDISSNISMWMAPEQKQVKSSPYRLCGFLPSVEETPFRQRGRSSPYRKTWRVGTALSALQVSHSFFGLLGVSSACDKSHTGGCKMIQLCSFQESSSHWIWSHSWWRLFPDALSFHGYELFLTLSHDAP